MPETNNFAATALMRLGVDPTNLGCVMLDVVLPDIYKQVLSPEWAYYSSILKYVNGYNGKGHITLLYGLLLNASTNRDLIDGVMEGWVKPEIVLFDTFDVFEGNDGVADYGAIILKSSEGRTGGQDIAELHDANYRLGKLPHVRSFPDYNPHITIGYVQKQFIEQALTELRMREPRSMSTLDLNYGGV